MYADGRGVKRDYNKAVKWYRKAAGKGVAEAQFNLGLARYNGRGATRNFVQAHKWSIPVDIKIPFKTSTV
jgi:TPR repeat protein